MKKLLSLLGTVSLTVTTSGVVACEKKEETKETENKQELNKIINIVNLGAITITASKPTTKELLNGIKAKNSGADKLTEDDFEIKGTPTLTSATITGKGKFTGEVKLNYSKA